MVRNRIGSEHHGGVQASLQKACALPWRDPAPTLPEVPLHLHARTRLHRATALEIPSIGICRLHRLALIDSSLPQEPATRYASLQAGRPNTPGLPLAGRVPTLVPGHKCGSTSSPQLLTQGRPQRTYPVGWYARRTRAECTARRLVAERFPASSMCHLAESRNQVCELHNSLPAGETGHRTCNG